MKRCARACSIGGKTWKEGGRDGRLVKNFGSARDVLGDLHDTRARITLFLSLFESCKGTPPS